MYSLEGVPFKSQLNIQPGGACGRYSPILGHPSGSFPIDDSCDVPVIVYEKVVRTKIVVRKTYTMLACVRSLDNVQSGFRIDMLGKLETTRST